MNIKDIKGGKESQLRELNSLVAVQIPCEQIYRRSSRVPMIHISTYN